MMDKIVTFSCQKKVFVFKDGCGKSPMPPYKLHDDINEARNYLRDTRGIENAPIVFMGQTIENKKVNFASFSSN